MSPRKLSSLLKILKFLCFSLFLLAICLFVSYLLNWKSLSFLPGNDATAYYSQLTWLSNYWPRVPNWYELEGGGVSLNQGYPIASHWLIIAFSRVTSLSLIQSLQFWLWLCLPLAAVGVGVLVREWSRHWLPGFLGAVFFLISPLSWGNYVQWGFFADVSSYIFVPWSWLFLVWHFRFYSKSPFLSRLFLAVSAVFTSLVWLMHPLSGLGASLVLLVIYIAYKLSGKRDKVTKKKVFLNWSCVYSFWKEFIVLGLSAFLLTSWWLVPFYRYSRFANREGLTVGEKSYDQFVDQAVGLDTFLSLKVPVFPDKDYPLRNFSLPVLVWFLALLGIVLAFFKSRKIFWLGLLCLLSVWLVTSPWSQYAISKFLPSLFGLIFSRRGMWLVLRMLSPAFAAIGVWWLSETLFLLPFRSFLKIKIFSFVAQNIFIPSLCLLVVYFTLVLCPSLFPALPSFWKVVGPRNFDWRDIWGKTDIASCETNPNDALCHLGRVADDINQPFLFTECSILRSSLVSKGFTPPLICDQYLGTNPDAETIIFEFKRECKDGSFKFPSLCYGIYPSILTQLPLKNWPAFVLGSDDRNLIIESARDLLFELEKAAGDGRWDISPRIGDLISKSSIIATKPRLQLYMSQLSLNHAYWGYQASSFFSPDDSLYGDSAIVDNQAGYYGINAVAFPKEQEALLDRYSSWMEFSSPLISTSTVLLKNSNPTSLADFSNKKRVLVIGSKKERAYEQVLRASNRGLFPYDKYLIVEGAYDLVDKYSLKDLQDFDLIWLYGYGYSNRQAAHRLLETYLNTGGFVFMDTGWQYISADWQGSNLPEFFPSLEISWKATTGMPALSSPALGDVSYLPPTLSDWGFSSFTKEQLRSTFTSRISSGNNILVASSNQGKGVILWSGLNYVAYSLNQPGETQKSQSLLYLRLLLESVFGWNTITSSTNIPIEYSRPDPVSARITFKQGINSTASLYWKENWYYDWQAFLVTDSSKQRLNVRRTGPGMISVVVPPVSSGDWVSFVLKPSVIHYFSYFATLIGVFFLLFFLFSSQKQTPPRPKVSS